MYHNLRTLFCKNTDKSVQLEALDESILYSTSISPYVMQAFGSVEPEEWCLFDEVEEVEITGDGFTDNIIRENASCTFRTQDNQLFGNYNTQTSILVQFSILVQSTLNT